MRPTRNLRRLLGACCLTFLAHASPAHSETLSLQIANIPPTASGLVVVVDGNGETYRGEQSLSAGTTSTTVVMGVPAGIGYRVRVIATAGGTVTYPSVVAGGKALGILVAGGQLTVAAIGLAAPTLTVDPANPTSVAPASPVTLRWTIHDPSQFLEGAGGMRLWWTTDATAGNATGVQVAGSLSGSVGDDFNYMATFTAPSGASTLHYQFGEVSQAFTNLDGIMPPFLVLPDRNTGASRLALSVSAPSTGASVQISNIPSIATGVVVVVDGNDATYRVQQELSEGATSTTVSMGVPAGTGYRVRVIAIAGGNIIHPSVVAGGKALAIPVTSGQLTPVPITLAEPTLTPDPENPTSAASGSLVTLRWTVHDPARFLDDLGGMRLWWTTAAAANNATGVSVAGSLTGRVGDDFSYSVTFTVPSVAGTLYYQVGEASPAFSDPAGIPAPAPVLILPDRNTGAARLVLSVPAPSTGASILVSSIPPIATGLVIVVDGNGATYRAEQALPVGTTSTTVVMGVAAGAGYRVRVIAIGGGNIPHPSVLAGGKAHGVTFTSGQLLGLGIGLAPPTLTPDPTNPTHVETSSLVTLRWTVHDPAQFLDGTGGMRLWWTTAAGAGNVTGVVVAGSLIGSVGDDLSYVVTFNAPSMPTTMRYQFGRGAAPFGNPIGAPEPVLALPDWNTGAPRLLLTVDTRPFPPTGFAAITRHAGVRLTWAAAPGATSYTVRRGYVPGRERPLAEGITGTEFVDTTATPGTLYFYVVSSVNSLGEVSSSEVSVMLPASPTRVGDFDRDIRSEISIWRPSTGEWLTRLSSTEFTAQWRYVWGEAGDVPVPADYDADGRNDFAVWRPSTGQWFILLSTTDYTEYRVLEWGTSGDVPVPADYTGDGRAEVAFWRPSTGQWFIWLSTSAKGTYRVYQWGLPGDTPIAADFDGDLRAEIGIWRPSTGRWHLRWSASNYTSQAEVAWGGTGDTPLTGDFDGDGRADIGVWRPSEGGWYVLLSSSNWTASVGYSWGLAGDTVSDADFDGDGRADLAVWRPSTGEWLISGSASHYGAYTRYVLGASGDVAVPGRRIE